MLLVLKEGIHPTTYRGGGILPKIDKIHTTGWINHQYDFIDNGGWLYNRCHLIAFCLTAENANASNLITGTRQMNLAMTDFEISVADYVRKTGNSVLYRATPVYDGTSLVCSGIQLEALGVLEIILIFPIFLRRISVLMFLSTMCKMVSALII